MLVQSYERRLCQILADFPFQHNFRYTKDASQDLKRVLFRSLAAENDGYLDGLFKGRIPEHGVEWSLSDAQGLTEEMEYTEAARGTPCVSKYQKRFIPSHSTWKGDSDYASSLGTHLQGWRFYIPMHDLLI